MNSRTPVAVMFLLLVISFTVFAGGNAIAKPEFFGQNCAVCHFDDTATCNGCHKHGATNLTATTDLDQYQPGQTVTVLFGGGSRDGWIRAILYDHLGLEIDRVTGPTGMGDDGIPSPVLEFPVLLSAPAP